MHTKPSRRSLIAAALALTAGVLACALAGPSASPTPAANLATVTPGGRISVSLLTPTLTQIASGSGGEPIGPVATATAEALAAFAATQTALVPSPTIAGVFTDPAECPAPGSPPLPTRPLDFTRYPETVVQFLSAGGAPTVLEARLRAWGAINAYGGLVRADRDFTGDGVSDVLVVLLDPAYDDFPYPGTLYLFGCQDRLYRLLYQTGYAPDQSFPVLHNADDINGDYLNDLVYSIQSCGDLLCTTRLEIAEWRLSLASFSSLLGADLPEDITAVRVSDPDGDGVADIVVTSGGVTSAAAGPRREVTTTLSWNGSLFIAGETVQQDAVYRIHVLHDADAAQKLGDHVTAMQYYQQAIDDDDLLSWQYPSEADYLRAYARYRMVVGYAMQNDLANAQRVHDELVGLYAGPTPIPPAEGEPTPIPPPTLPPSLLPGGEFAEMARLFWREYLLSRNMEIACRVVRTYAQINPSSYDVLNSFGLSNPVYTPDDLCPVP